MLEELANVLSGETHHHTIVLASTSGSGGAAGAAQLARSLPQPVDAVIVLGDLAGRDVRQPVVVPWSNDPVVAPPQLRNTVATALSQQARLSPGASSLGGQFAHLAFPFTATEQAPFGAQGQSAVLLSVSGERAPAADEPVSATRIASMGRTALQTVNALDGSRSVPGPSAYLLFDGKVVPAWAMRLLVLALIVPVLGATIDGIARVRRRGHSMLRWAVWVLCAALPFVFGLVLVYVRQADRRVPRDAVRAGRRRRSATARHRRGRAGDPRRRDRAQPADRAPDPDPHRRPRQAGSGQRHVRPWGSRRADGRAVRGRRWSCGSPTRSPPRS